MQAENCQVVGVTCPRSLPAGTPACRFLVGHLPTPSAIAVQQLLPQIGGGGRDVESNTLARPLPNYVLSGNSCKRDPLKLLVAEILLGWRFSSHGCVRCNFNEEGQRSGELFRSNFFNMQCPYEKCP